MVKYLVKYTLLVLSLYFLLASCEKNDLKKVAGFTGKDTIPSQIANDITVIYSDSAKVKARLTSPKMIQYITGDQNTEMPIGLKVLFYNDSLKAVSSLRADYGIRYPAKYLIKVTGNVVVSNTKGDTLHTEELFWDENRNIIYSNTFVKVKQPDKVILAEGFNSDVNFLHYTFKKVRGTFSINSPEAR